MKNLMIVMFLSLLAPFALAGEKEPAEKVEYMQKTLQLNDEQTQQIEKILTEANDRKKALASEYTFAQKEEYREAKKEVYEELKMEISDVLTPSQLTAMEAMKEARKKMMKKHCPQDDKHDKGKHDKHKKDGYRMDKDNKTS